jgi:hypothetical protein
MKDFTFWLLIIFLFCIALSGGYFIVHIFRDDEPVQTRLDVIIGLLVIISFAAVTQIIPKKNDNDD